MTFQVAYRACAGMRHIYCDQSDSSPIGRVERKTIRLGMEIKLENVYALSVKPHVSNSFILNPGRMDRSLRGTKKGGRILIRPPRDFSVKQVLTSIGRISRSLRTEWLQGWLRPPHP